MRGLLAARQKLNATKDAAGDIAEVATDGGAVLTVIGMCLKNGDLDSLKAVVAELHKDADGVIKGGELLQQLAAADGSSASK